MGYIVFHMREESAPRFDKAMKALTFATDELCALTEEMRSQYGERGPHPGPGYAGYGERHDGQHYDGRYQMNGGYDERSYYPKQYPAWDERRDSRGRYM